jgi:hypothetical protein
LRSDTHATDSTWSGCHANSAAAAGGDFDEDFVGADARDRERFEPKVICAAINNRAHRAGNAGHRENSNRKDER